MSRVPKGGGGRQIQRGRGPSTGEEMPAYEGKATIFFAFPFPPTLFFVQSVLFLPLCTLGAEVEHSWPFRPSINLHFFCEINSLSSLPIPDYFVYCRTLNALAVDVVVLHSIKRYRTRLGIVKDNSDGPVNVTVPVTVHKRHLY